MNKMNLEISEVVSSSKELGDAVDVFLSNPSFSSKQKALELLLGQITQTNPAASHNAGAINIQMT